MDYLIYHFGIILEALEPLDTIVPDDTTLVKKYYTTMEAKRPEFDLTYNILNIKTTNPIFNVKLNIILRQLTQKYIDNWLKQFYEYETADDRKYAKGIWQLGIHITPLFLKGNMASFYISNGEYTGGVHGGFASFYKNYIFQNGQVKEMNSEDFIDDAINTDTVYFNRLKKTIEFESTRPGYEDCLVRTPSSTLSDFISETDTLYDMPYRKINFVFHEQGIKIKYYTDWYVVMHGELGDFADKLIPKKEFNKIMSKTLAVVWRE